MPIFGVILVRIFPHSDWILRIQSECAKMRTKITPNTDTSYTVLTWMLISVLLDYLMLELIAVICSRQAAYLNSHRISPEYYRWTDYSSANVTPSNIRTWGILQNECSEKIRKNFSRKTLVARSPFIKVVVCRPSILPKKRWSIKSAFLSLLRSFSG